MKNEIPDYYEIKNDYQKLGDIVFTHEKSGREHMAFSFCCQIWLTGTWLNSVRQKLISVQRGYFDLFKDDITHYQRNGSNTLSLIKSKQFPAYYDTLLNKVSQDDYLNLRLGDFSDGLPSCDFHALAISADRQDKSPLSYVEMKFPIRWFKTNKEAALGFINETCDLLSPTCGTCGIAPFFEIGNADPNYYFPLLKRFPGLDFSNGSWGLAVGNNKKICRTNWITIVSDDLLDLSGFGSKEDLPFSNQITVKPYDGGLIIQAGYEPFIGDANADVRPERYEEVGRALNSLIFRDYIFSRSYLNVPKRTSLDRLDETLLWLSRFNQGSK